MNNTTKNIEANIKTMTFDQLVIEWDKSSDKITNIRRKSDWVNSKPFTTATNDKTCEKAQKKMWAIEKEIVCENFHKIPDLKKTNPDLYACIVLR